MTNSIFDAAYVQRQREMFESSECVDLDAIHKAFNFVLEDLPQHQRYLADYPPSEASRRQSFQLDCGHAITVTEMVQFSSQDGVYEGMQHPLSSFAAAIARAKAVFPYFEGLPHGLPPLLHRSFDGLPGKDAWIATPPICTVAMFDSQKPAKDESADMSCVLLIWFQDEFGFSLSERVKQQIQSIEWQAIATDRWL